MVGRAASVGFFSFKNSKLSFSDDGLWRIYCEGAVFVAEIGVAMNGQFVAYNNDIIASAA